MKNNEYVEIEKSEALPILSAEVLSGFLNRRRKETQPKVLFAFEDRLKKQP